MTRASLVSYHAPAPICIVQYYDACMRWTFMCQPARETHQRYCNEHRLPIRHAGARQPPTPYRTPQHDPTRQEPPCVESTYCREYDRALPASAKGTRSTNNDPRPPAASSNIDIIIGDIIIDDIEGESSRTRTSTTNERVLDCEHHCRRVESREEVQYNTTEIVEKRYCGNIRSSRTSRK